VTATLAGIPVSRAVLRIPRYGAALAEVQLLDDTPLPAGTRAPLQIGNLVMVGTVRPGGAFGGITGVSWIAGGDGWSRTVDRRATPTHNDAGVLLSQVAADLALDAGEIGVLLGVPDRPVGQDWVRPLALARDLLDALSGGQWWVDGAGITHIGPRLPSAIALPTLTVDPYDPALRMGTARVADDLVAGLVPGATLTAPGLPAPLAIGQTVLRLDGGALDVDLYGERTGADLLDAYINALTSWRAYLRAVPYQVTGVAADGRVAVVPADARGVLFPSAPLLGHAPGLPGASYTLAPGARVVVGCLAGDPGSPVVQGHLPGALPVSVVLDAATSISLGTGGAPLALAAAADARDAALLVGVNAALAHLSLPLISLPASSAATKARGV
jgi:hypothetical protein